MDSQLKVCKTFIICRAPDRVHEETDEQETDEDCYEDSTQSGEIIYI